MQSPALFCNFLNYTLYTIKIMLYKYALTDRQTFIPSVCKNANKISKHATTTNKKLKITIIDRLGMCNGLCPHNQKSVENHKQ